MGYIKIVKFVDIDADQGEVFDLLLDVKRRMQLAPTWGEHKIDHIPPDHPEEGSRIRLIPDKTEDPDRAAFDLVITEYQPGKKLAYRFEDPVDSRFTWTLAPSTQGTRLTLEAEYEQPVSEDAGDEEEETEQEKLERQAQEWTNNIKRYSELDDSLPQRLLKRILDGFILEMPAFQRRVLLILIAFQFVTFLTFLIAAIGFAIARFLFM